ncbi:MAG: ABC transporter ATP-binding protein [Chloroflexota bacterium]
MPLDDRPKHPASKPGVSSRQALGMLGRYLRPLWRQALAMTALVLGGITLQLLLPQVMRRFIDAVQAGAQQAALLQLGALYLAVALVQQVIALGAAYFSENVGWSATNALRGELAAHLLGLDLSFHNAHTPGEMIERIDGDITTLSNFFTRFAVQVAGNLIFLGGVLVLMFAIDWRIGLAVGGFAVLTLALLLRFRDLAVPYWKAERQASADLFGFLEERLAGVEDIRANGGRDYVMNRFHLLMRALLDRALRAGQMINILLNTSMLLFAGGIAAAFTTGAYLYGQGEISLGTVYLVFQYTTMLQRPIEEITRQLQDFQRAGAGLARVSELLDERSRLAPPLPAEDPRAAAPDHTPRRSPNALAAPAAADLPAPVDAALSLTFDAVRFTYPDALPAPETSQDGPEPPAAGEPGAADAPPPLAPAAGEAAPLRAGELVLDGVSFHLPAGETLGVLGRTGSGKTTLTRLLFRLYDPDAGAIRVSAGPDGAIDLRRLPLPALRARIGMIPQNVQLFNATVRENLTFFNPGIPDRLVLEALHGLGLGSWLAALPAGLDTRLEAGGSGLSAGQAQLLAFARIFLRRPGLVVLDEASSRLDPATEAWIETAIDRLVQGRTALIVAHRLATVQRADWVLVLEAGQVCEFGRRAQLASDPSSHFHRLLESGLEEVLV